jgi:hypothetical protein
MTKPISTKGLIGRMVAAGVVSAAIIYVAVLAKVFVIAF